MADYVLINGTQTWYDVQGQGETLVLLHPGGVGVDTRAFEPNLAALTAQFRVFLPERRGHGRSPDTAVDYSYELVADDMISFIETVIGKQPVRLAGMSDGAVVALLIAHKRPDLVDRLVCIAGVYNNNGWLPGVIEPTDEPPDFLIKSYAELSPDGAEHYRVVHQKLHQMHVAGPNLTTRELNAISCRTLVMVGDDDEVALEHALSFYRSLPKGELAVIPGTSHGLLIEKSALCEFVIFGFLRHEMVHTIAPIRRKHN